MKNVKLEEILLKYKDGKATLEETNKALAEIGYPPLRNLTDAERLEQKEREDREGFIEAKEEPLLPDVPDMRRNKANAGKKIEQQTNIGKFLVTYNENGYAISAKRI